MIFCKAFFTVCLWKTHNFIKPSTKFFRLLMHPYFMISRSKKFVCSTYTTRSLIVDKLIACNIHRALATETQFCLT